MRDARDILIEYNKALEANDIVLMAELISEMKKVEPLFVSLMIDSIETENE